MLTFKAFVLSLSLLILQLEYSSCSKMYSSSSIKFINIDPQNKSSHRGIIQTPNFPNAFPTPCVHKWVLNASQWESPFEIVLYMTQFYIKDDRYLKFLHYNSLPTGLSEEQFINLSNSESGVKYIEDDINEWTSAVLISSRNSSFLVIDLKLNSSFEGHLRTGTLLNHYGFNITYEIIQQKPDLVKVSPKEKSCTFKRCSYGGHCYVQHSYQEFYCDCFKGRFGPSCEFGDVCDPISNINNCYNGGKCRMLDDNYSVCNCSGTGYKGSKCELRENITSPAQKCDFSPLTNLTSDRAMSTSPPQGLVIYRGQLILNSSLSVEMWDSKNSTETPEEVTLLQRELAERLNQTFGTSVEMVVIISIRSHFLVVYQFYGKSYILGENYDILNNLLDTRGELLPGFAQSSYYDLTMYPPLEIRGLWASSNGLVIEGRHIILTCTAIGSRRTQFTWFKNGVIFNTTLIMKNVYLNNFPVVTGGTSFLSFTKTSSYDSGIYTCKVSDGVQEKCMSVNVEVVSTPRVHLQRSKTVLQNQTEIVLVCRNHREESSQIWKKSNLTFRWEKNHFNLSETDPEIVEDLIYQGNLLRIPKTNESAIYTCVSTNIAGVTRRTVDVRVLNSSDSLSCPNDTEVINARKLYWEWSAPNLRNTINCPQNYKGFVYRKCQMIGTKPIWSPSNFTNCVNRRSKRILKILQSLKRGFVISSGVSKIWELMENYIFQTELLPGEKLFIKSLVLDVTSSVDRTLTQKYLHERFTSTKNKTLQSLNDVLEKLLQLHIEYLPTFSVDFTSDTFLLEEITNKDSKITNQDDTALQFPAKSYTYPEWLDVQLQFEIGRNEAVAITIIRNIKQIFASTIEIEGGRGVVTSSIVKMKKFTTKHSNQETEEDNSISKERRPGVLPTPSQFLSNTTENPLVSSSHSNTVTVYFNRTENALHGSETIEQNYICAILSLSNEKLEWTGESCSINITVDKIRCDCNFFENFLSVVAKV